jgi:hypothetical protein
VTAFRGAWIVAHRRAAITVVLRLIITEGILADVTFVLLRLEIISERFVDLIILIANIPFVLKREHQSNNSGYGTQGAETSSNSCTSSFPGMTRIGVDTGCDTSGTTGTGTTEGEATGGTNPDQSEAGGTGDGT